MKAFNCCSRKQRSIDASSSLEGEFPIKNAMFNHQVNDLDEKKVKNIQIRGSMRSSLGSTMNGD